jgi:hypothetical protein
LVDELFRRQHGLITRAQALAAGLTRRQIDGLLSSGAWCRVGRGVYRIASTPVTFEQRALAACLLAGPDAVASHTTAGAILLVEGIRPGRIEITVPHGRHPLVPGTTVHQARSLLPRERIRVRGIPVTSLPRTLVDLAGRLSERALVEAVDGAICGKRTTVTELRDAAGNAGASRRGAAALGRSLTLWTPGPLPESIAEMRLIRRLVGEGFPPPVRQYRVYLGTRFVGRVDLAYPVHRVAIEYDGVRRHLDPSRARENDLIAAGWRPLTATAVDLRRGATRFYQTLGALLERADHL